MEDRAKHHEKFEHAGYTVNVFINDLDGLVDFDLDRFIGEPARRRNDYSPELAQFAMLKRAVEGLKVSEGNKVKTYSFSGGKKSPPRMKDPDTGLTLAKHLLGYVIKHNMFLVEEEEYREAFEEYVLDEEVVPAKNPTPLRADTA